MQFLDPQQGATRWSGCEECRSGTRAAADRKLLLGEEELIWGSGMKWGPVTPITARAVAPAGRRADPEPRLQPRLWFLRGGPAFLGAQESRAIPTRLTSRAQPPWFSVALPGWRPRTREGGGEGATPRGSQLPWEGSGFCFWPQRHVPWKASPWHRDTAHRPAAATPAQGQGSLQQQ